MEKLARLLRCGSLQYDQVDRAPKVSAKQQEIDRLNDISDYIYSIKLGNNATSKLTIPRFINSETNNRWEAMLENINEETIIDVLTPLDKFSNNNLLAQHFEIVGKKPGKVTLLLAEVNNGKNIKVVRVPITVE